MHTLPVSPREQNRPFSETTWNLSARPFMVSPLTQQGSPVPLIGLWQQRRKLFQRDDSVSDLSLCPWPRTEPSILNSN